MELRIGLDASREDVPQGDLRRGGDDAVDHLVTGHFKREDTHGVPRKRGVACDVERKCGFSGGRAGTQNDKVRFLESGKLVIKLLESRGDTAQAIASRMKLLDALEGALQFVFDSQKILRHRLLGDREDFLFNIVQEIVDLLRVEHVLRDLGCGFHEIASNPLFLHDIRIMLDVGCGCHLVREFGKIARTADDF